MFATAETNQPERRLNTNEDRWRAIQHRDRGRDGQFVFAVSTTGIYCRPSCPARRPRQENVRFFDDPAAAGVAADGGRLVKGLLHLALQAVHLGEQVARKQASIHEGPP